jgi:hypothetical protein
MSKKRLKRFPKAEISEMLEYIRLQLESAVCYNPEEVKGEILKDIDDTIQKHVQLLDDDE